MMLHVLSGRWPFPGEAVRVNPRNPNDPNDLVGVTEFDRREEYANLVGNEHPLMTLIQGCLSNSPSHRPTSSEVHQRVSAVAAEHPPSFTNRVEMMDRIKVLGEEKERERSEKENAIVQKDVAIAERARSVAELTETQSTIDNLHKSHSIEVEALWIENTDMKAENEHLQATITAKEKRYRLEQEIALQKYEKQLEVHKKEKQAMEEQFQSTIRNDRIEKERLIDHRQQEIDLIKHNHQEELETLKRNHQSDKQSLEQQHKLQLSAMENKHRTVKQAMEQRHQAQLESRVSELSAKDALISSKSSTIQSLQTKLGQALGTSSSKDILSVFSPGVKLISTECAKVPGAISGLDQGVVIGRDVYVGVTHEKKVFKYCITEDSWSTLPLAPVKYNRIGRLYKKVLTIGGQLPSSQVTADIHEFDVASQQWVRSTSIPPMPTARSSAAVVSLSSPPALIVCGGNDRQSQPMTIVEVYLGRTSQWHTITQLPFPRAAMKHTVIGNKLYLIGGVEGSTLGTYKKTVMSTSIPQLVDACLQPSRIQWKSLSIPNVPNYLSTAASLGGCLLVVGGTKDRSMPPTPKSVISSVHAYCPFTSSWVLIGELPQPLYSSITATLPTGELLVVGGGSSSGRANSTTYKCSLSVPMQQ